MRVNVFIPDELARTVRAELPGLNVSKLVQAAMAAAIGCTHDKLACELCGRLVDRSDVAHGVLDAFYRDALDHLEQLISRCGTAEGAARILKDLATSRGVGAFRPLPRPTRAERQLALEFRWAASQ